MIIHILLFILKLLLGILLFVLLALLYLVIFPWSITAKANGNSQEKEITGNIRVNGFLHFWKVLIDPWEEELISVKAFWGLVTLYPRPKKESKKKHRRKNKNKSIDEQEVSEKSHDREIIPESLDTITDENISETPDAAQSTAEESEILGVDGDYSQGSEKSDTNPASSEEENTASEEKEKPKFSKRFLSGVSNILRRITDMIGRIVQSLRNVTETISDMDIPGKVSRVTDIITAPENTAAVKTVFQQLSWLIKKMNIHLKDTHVEFGIDDPMTTGQICAVLSVLPAVYEGDSEIVPDFTSDEIYIRGKAGVRLRFAAWYLLRIAWKLWRDRNTNKIIKKFLNR